MEGTLKKISKVFSMKIVKTKMYGPESYPKVKTQSLRKFL